MAQGTIKYEMEVLQLGELIGEFIDNGIVVFFGQNAPEELLEFSIIHNGVELKEEVIPGDMLAIGDEHFKILAVGDVANTNLANLGHFVVKFNGKTTPELPGDICVEAKPLPDIEIGTRVTIVSSND